MVEVGEVDWEGPQTVHELRAGQQGRRETFGTLGLAADSLGLAVDRRNDPAHGLEYAQKEARKASAHLAKVVSLLHGMQYICHRWGTDRQSQATVESSENS